MRNITCHFFLTFFLFYNYTTSIGQSRITISEKSSLEDNSPKNGVFPANPSLKGSFFFGGKFHVSYINLGISKIQNKRFLPTLGIVFLKYDYHPTFFSYTVGLNKTSLIALSLACPYNYGRLLKNKVKLFLGPDLNLSYSKVTFNNSLQFIRLKPIYAPIIFISHEITYDLKKNIWIHLNTSLGYGKALINSNKNSYDLLTDRVDGYFEARINYGLRIFY